MTHLNPDTGAPIPYGASVRQFRFAEAVHEGKGQREAALAAGYKDGPGLSVQASKLLRNPKVERLLVHLRVEAGIDPDATDDVIEWLWKEVRTAKSDQARVAALKAIDDIRAKREARQKAEGATKDLAAQISASLPDHFAKAILNALGMTAKSLASAVDERDRVNGTGHESTGHPSQTHDGLRIEQREQETLHD